MSRYPNHPDDYPRKGIAVDCAHSSKNGVTMFRGIDLASGQQVFFRELGNQTVNIGEFLAVVFAVKHIIESKYSPRKIYSDSMTAITWFKEKRTASKKNNVELKQAEIFLKTLAIEVDQIELIHWNKALWGEIPADFGNK